MKSRIKRLNCKDIILPQKDAKGSLMSNEKASNKLIKNRNMLKCTHKHPMKQ
jgi:hypothetical protein